MYIVIPNIAERVNDYFANIGPALASQSECLSDFDDSHSNLTDVNSKFYFHMIAVADIEKTLKNLKVSKATGVDGTSAKILKLSSNIISPSFTYIFNLSIPSGIFVDD